MTKRALDPHRLDVAAFAQHAGALAGDWAMAAMRRLAEAQQAPQDWTPEAVKWSVRGELRAVAGDAPQIWLHLQAHAAVWLVCQRCLNPVLQTVDVDRAIRFVRGEDQAEALDAESEDDVLALSPALDLQTLTEDELLLALPIVPHHEVCPQGAVAPAEPLDVTPAPSEPFAALAALKGRRG